LPVTRQLIEAHGGPMTAISAPGRGSVFTIWLPVAADDREAHDGGKVQ
jgi:signal transduction histidine kinase